MWIKKLRPTTPGRRNMTVNSFEEITSSKPHKSLTTYKKRQAWRGFRGKITTRHQWWGHKRRYRYVDFYMTDKLWIPAKVESIEYDPYRSAFIALVCYLDGERRYILAHSKMNVWDKIVTNEQAELETWNRMQIWNIPTWFAIHNLELIVGQWVSAIRSAGSQGFVISQEWKYTQVKMPSGEVRLVNKRCYATIGQVSNTEHNQVVIGKAGRSRHMGIRPTVRWLAMNPVDHPHGWWEGWSPIGMKYPKTPWGKVALWKKTRSKKKYTNRWINRTRSGRLMKK